MSTTPLITDQMRRLLQTQAAIPTPAPVPLAPQQMQPLAVPAMPQVANVPNASDLTNRRLLTDQNNLSTTIKRGRGIDRIGNPVDAAGNPTGQHVSGLRKFAGVLARIGDVAAAGVLGGGSAAIPGTTAAYHADLRRQTGLVNSDLAQQQQQAQNEDMQAQAVQRRALGEQEQAKAYNLTHPKPGMGQILYDKTGAAIGFQDPSGRYMGIEDPELPHGVGEILHAAQRKQPTNAFELWQSQNPKGTAEDYLRMAGEGKVKPLEQQLLDAEKTGDDHTADTIRRVLHETRVQPKIDIHAATAAPSGAPSSTPGQISPLVQAIIDGRAPAPNARTKQGMALMAAVAAADPTYDASRYNTYQAMQKDMTSGKTGVSINSLNTIQKHIERALTNMPHNTGSAPLNYLLNKGSEAVGGNPTGKFEVDATGIAGEWAKLVAGGVASETEQKHVQALLSPNASPQKMRDNLNEIREMTQGKLDGINKQIQSAVHPGAGNNAPSSISGSNGGDQLISVQIPGQPAGQIHASQKAAFLAKYPNAQVLK